MKNTALIIIDIQNDYFPGGALELVKPEAAASQAARLISSFRSAELPLFHIQHVTPPESGLPFLVEGSSGAEIHPLVAPRENEVVIQKTFPNSFFKTDLNERLQSAQITNLILCGMMTHMCVSATARAALELGYQTIVASDATTTRGLELEGETVSADTVKKGNLAALESLVASIMDTDSILSDLATIS